MKKPAGWGLRARGGVHGLAAPVDRHDQDATIVKAGDHPDNERYDTTRRFTTAIAKEIDARC